MSLSCAYTNCTIVRKEPRFRSPHYIPVKNPQPSTHSLGTDLNEYLLIGHSFKSVPNEHPKRGATAMVTPLSIGYVSASP